MKPTTSLFSKATKKSVFLKLAITGPTGSGKTYSALRLASGLGKRIAVIDTENRSASLYADKFDFEVINLEPPFTVEKYTAAIEAAEAGNFDCLIIDSLTHAWAGDGGLLAKKEGLDARGGNSFTNWGAITKEHENFKSWVLQSQLNIIGTMRSKMEYVMETTDKGKQAPKKVGLAPIQRDGIEYEFTTVFDVAMNHEAAASKDRTGLFDGKIFQITEETGALIRKWQGGDPERLKQPIPPKGQPPAKSVNAEFDAGGELDAAPPAAGNPFFGDYEIKFGQWKGSKLKDVKPADLRSYCEFLEASAKEKGVEITGNVAAFIDAVLNFLPKQN